MSFSHIYRDPVLLVLVAASLVSWGLIINCLLALRRTAQADRKSDADAPIARLRAELRRNASPDSEHLLATMDTIIALERQKLDQSLPLLGVIGSTAPYMGLLGTVIGIIQAFQAIQAQNNMSPSVVAGGIATALVATAMGLAVAIPAVAAHHLLTAAISRRVAVWEAAVAEWLPRNASGEGTHEPVSRT